MRISYDFHIHTTASPCGDEAMTLNNIINLSYLLGKQIIAITDHQSCGNCEVAVKLGRQKGIIVIPGMEIECMEEFHAIALFPSLDAAKYIEKEVQGHMPYIKNQTHIFGHQWLLDEEGEVAGEIERMLLVATNLSIHDLVLLIKQCGGILYPAHIDRSAYSILSNLGTVPDDLDFKVLEISKMGNQEVFERQFNRYKLLRSSDAHTLEALCESEQFLELEYLSQTQLFGFLKS